MCYNLRKEMAIETSKPYERNFSIRVDLLRNLGSCEFGAKIGASCTSRTKFRSVERILLDYPSHDKIEIEKKDTSIPFGDENRETEEERTPFVARLIPHVTGELKPTPVDLSNAALVIDTSSSGATIALPPEIKEIGEHSWWDRGILYTFYKISPDGEFNKHEEFRKIGEKNPFSIDLANAFRLAAIEEKRVQYLVAALAVS
jgi:hypothetical protein